MSAGTWPKFGAIFILIFSLSSGAAAPSAGSDCSALRLDVPGKAMEHVPVNSQRDLAICFAEVGAQMVDAYRFSHGDRDFAHLTSSLQAAHFAKRNRKPEDYIGRYYFERGKACEAVNAIRSHGSCNRKNEWQIESPAMSKGAEEMMGRSFASSRPLTGSLDAIACVVDSFSQGRPISIRHPLEALDPVLDQVVTPDRFKAGVKQGCKGDNLKRSFIPSCKQWPEAMDASLPSVKTEFVNQLLNKVGKAQQPVGIAFCANIFDDRKTRQLRVDGSTATLVIPESCERHEAMIIGREMREGRCQFIVRNSWSKNYKGGYAWPNKDGNIWIDAEDLMRQTIAATYLER